MKTNITIPEKLNKTRLDVALSSLLPQYSRNKIQNWIKSGYITVDHVILRAKDKINTNQTIQIDAPDDIVTKSEPQSIAIEIVYEDPDLAIINKPAGLVVHPGAGCKDNTLLNAILYHFPKNATIPRAGIIHRLDKDTSGLLVIAKTLNAHTKLVDELQNRKIKREYAAIVNGVVNCSRTITAPIGRHPFKRTHMTVKERGKPATTHIRVVKRFDSHTYLRVILETGRTHQIRVHLSHLGYPIVGDQTYGKGLKIPVKADRLLQETLRNFKRQALHAKYLSLTHPQTGKILAWEIDLPEDMEKLLEMLNLKTCK